MHILAFFASFMLTWILLSCSARRSMDLFVTHRRVCTLRKATSKLNIYYVTEGDHRRPTNGIEGCFRGMEYDVTPSVRCHCLLYNAHGFDGRDSVEVYSSVLDPRGSREVCTSSSSIRGSVEIYTLSSSILLAAEKYTPRADTVSRSRPSHRQ